MIDQRVHPNNRSAQQNLAIAPYHYYQTFCQGKNVKLQKPEV